MRDQGQTEVVLGRGAVMGRALSMLLFIVIQPLLKGKLPPPRNVSLISENFNYFLLWESDLSAGNDVHYEADIISYGRRNMTKMEGSKEIVSGSSWKCQLHLPDIHGLYWVRVRMVCGTRVSNWTLSNELQPYRDTILGPPLLSLKLNNLQLQVTVSLPLTSYRRKDGSFKSVEDVKVNVEYKVVLCEVDTLICTTKTCKHNAKITCFEFNFLRPNCLYCISSRVEGHQSKEAKLCIRTQFKPIGLEWLVIIVLTILVVVVLLGWIIFFFLKRYVHPCRAEAEIPRILATFKEELNADLPYEEPEVEANSIFLLSPIEIISAREGTTKRPSSPTQELSGIYKADDGAEDYQNNGVDPGYSEASSRKTDSSEALDFEASLEAPNSAISGHLRHFHCFSPQQCPVREANSLHPWARPLDVTTKEASRDERDHWAEPTWRNIPLASVKLQGGQEAGDCLGPLRKLCETEANGSVSTQESLEAVEQDPSKSLPAGCDQPGLPNLPSNPIARSAPNGCKAEILAPSSYHPHYLPLLNRKDSGSGAKGRLCFA
ncbi:interferon gamma receptor 1-like [Tachyglossus aculeatus]|uniref:interferon gamma receptor 1-like n=1 Tax=Tachyglossus aculeatus TaxID=9261 RepID=UPI0018F6F5D7|nr:interferon gamma receptor 1-like [Tachyglossus aculeatus]